MHIDLASDGVRQLFALLFFNDKICITTANDVCVELADRTPDQTNQSLNPIGNHGTIIEHASSLPQNEKDLAFSGTIFAVAPLVTAP